MDWFGLMVNKFLYEGVMIMGGTSEITNFQIAKEEADKVDAQIIAALQKGCSFRVEAGAGSGKTYSLNRVIEWIQENKWDEYRRKKQNVVCITYTNAAVDVIAERLSGNSFVLPSTIHSFAWNAIKQFQSTLVSIIENDDSLQPEEGDFFKIAEVRYTLGHRYKENGIQYLYHDDVLKLFGTLLDNAKFRRVFANKYPLLLIDEYQDSYKPIVDRCIEYFITKGEGPQFGFFGDAWQTIYQSNKACGLIEHENLEVIKKSSNFRSAPRIVQLLNDIRPELPQQSAIDNFEGEVVVVTCDDYSGERRTDGNFKGDLPAEEMKARLSNLTVHIKNTVPSEESLKVLMITHKVLATQQGYERLLDILADGLRDKQDPFLLYFMVTVEPVYEAIQTSDMQLLFDTLGIKRYPITKKSEKAKWKELEQILSRVRSKRSIDVLKTVIDSKLIPVPPQVERYYQLYCTTPELIYSNGVTIKEFLELEYGQFLAAIDFLYPEAEFSTEHGVKGEEYDNVIFVISKGWNQYQFETYAPMINGSVPIPKGKETSFIRNRNLFYVCCSRPKKRLIFFVTIPIEPVFRAYLADLVGIENVYKYSQYLENQVHEGDLS
jgi:DNA helicase-2/ATP-dependent DNA helicase PcrA